MILSIPQKPILVSIDSRASRIEFLSVGLIADKLLIDDNPRCGGISIGKLLSCVNNNNMNVQYHGITAAIVQ
jgi:hypothetical protein